MCPGKALGETNVWIIICTLLTVFDVLPPSEGKLEPQYEPQLVRYVRLVLSTDIRGSSLTRLQPSETFPMSTRPAVGGECGARAGRYDVTDAIAESYIQIIGWLLRLMFSKDVDLRKMDELLYC